MYVLRNGASSLMREGSVFICRCYICYTVVSARVYPRCHGFQVNMDSVHHLSLHSAKQHFWSVVRSVKLLLAFDSTVVPGFSLLEIHDQDFSYFLDMHVFRNGASSSMREGAAYLCRRYVCCTVVSAQLHPCCQGSSILLTLCTLCHNTVLTFIQDIQMTSINAGFCSRLCFNLFNYSETAVSQPNGHGPDRRQV
jgi:hypothetical protein